MASLDYNAGLEGTVIFHSSLKVSILLSNPILELRSDGASTRTRLSVLGRKIGF